MKKYIIESVKNHDGTDRTDGKFPERIGSVITMLEAEENRPISYAYIADKDGNPKEGTFTGNTVREITVNPDTFGIKVKTASGIYKLIYCGEYKQESEYVNGLIADKCGDEALKASVRRTGIDDVTSVDLGTLLKNFK